MRERGLKCGIQRYILCQSQVAPHAGAWIEIQKAPASSQADPCRSPCGSVD